MNLIENGLVPIYEHEGVRAVDARELHERLESKQDFSDWIKARLEKNGFAEGVDYSIILGNRSDGLPGKPRTEYALTVDVAKELAMLEGNERGREVRRYFIAAEKRLMTIPGTSPLALFEQMLLVAKQQDADIKQLKGAVQVIRDTICDRPEDWRHEVNEKLNKAGHAAGGGGKYQELRRRSYDELEERAGCDLDRRLDNLKARMVGRLSKKAYDALCFLDAIKEDKRLMEIYWNIVNELAIKYAEDRQ
jgi:phage anti-repressor protein